MKNYRIILGSFIVSALFLSSCQDIDLLPKDNMPDELFWKTPDDFEKEVNWLYTRTETFGTKDTDSDIAYELNENTTSNGTLIAPNTDALWDSTRRTRAIPRRSSGMWLRPVSFVLTRIFG